MPAARRVKKPIRTFDGVTGRLLGSTGNTDLVNFGLNPGAATNWGATGSTGAASGASPATLPVVTVSASPLLSIPWWLWGLAGGVLGYWVARNYGKHISRGLKTASVIAAPR